MRRREYLVGALSVPVVGGAGCLSLSSIPDGGSNLTPEADLDVEVVATTTFDRNFTPICSGGESLQSDIEGSYGDLVTDHEFFTDTESGRYGVRGRIGPWADGNIPRIAAEFSDESLVSGRGFGLKEGETYLFTIWTSEGDPDAIDRYTLTVELGGVDDIGVASDEYVTVHGDWGEIGFYDGKPVYGYVGTVVNNHTKDVRFFPRLKAYTSDETVVYAGSGTVSSIDVSSGSSQIVYFPYQRCDPGKVIDVDVWMEWATMNNP